MKWTIKHYYPFGGSLGLQNDSLLSAASWDMLRTDEQGAAENSAFYMPVARQDWLKLCQESEFSATAATAIVRFASSRGYHGIVSVGAGRALVEYHIKRLAPELHLTCTEYSPKVVERLKRVFEEADEVTEFDITSSPWSRFRPGSLVLFNRLDTELDDRQWREVFRNTASSGVKDILMVATGFLTPRTLLAEIWSRVVGLIKRRRLTFAGYTRTKARFCELWQPHFVQANEIQIGSLTGLLLKRSASVKP